MNYLIEDNEYIYWQCAMYKKIFSIPVNETTNIPAGVVKNILIL
ncbi:MAG: hypothetical protein N4A76_09205 [Firmicutes bacterium]|nr:hypothetical protein [Bacillota bacterium]